MGLCYLHAFNDLDRSDSCFRAIMQVDYLLPEEARFRDLWNGIAEGNLGYNMLRREAYDEAIPLLKSSMENVLKFDDYAFASGPALNLADIYMKMNKLSEAKRYLDLAMDYNRRMPREGRPARIYTLLSKYCAATGNPTLSMAYADSMVAAYKKDEAQFNALQLMRVEQRRHLSEQREKEKQLYVEKLKSDNYLKIGIIVLAMLFVVCGLLFYTIVLYHRKKAAHQHLANKLQAWAQTHTEIIMPEIPAGQADTPEPHHRKTQDAPPDETDFLIMQEIEHLMTAKEIYKDAALTLDSLAQRLQTKRNYVSIAINRCTGKNFNTYINEYRIKESIRLLASGNKKLSIEGIAFSTGFNDRKTFYRAFKKITGLSPTEFVQRVEEK